MTLYVAEDGGGAFVTDASDAYGVSAAVGVFELSEAVSTSGELVVADCTVEVSTAVEVGEVCTVALIGSELVVADWAVLKSFSPVAVGLAEPSKAIWTGGELLVSDSAVGEVCDSATDGLFG